MRLPDKSSGVLCSGASVRDKYEFIDAEYAAAVADTATNAPTISQMCEWLGVSKSGFYEWRSNPGSATAKRREELKLFIRKAFDDSDGTYGYRRVHAQLLRWGVQRGDELVRAPRPWPRTGPEAATDGKPRFDLARFGRAYFGRLRERVIAAGNAGIYRAVMLFDGWGLHLSPAPDNVQGHPFHAANNINQIAITSIADYQVIPLDPRAAVQRRGR